MWWWPPNFQFEFYRLHNISTPHLQQLNHLDFNPKIFPIQLSIKANAKQKNTSGFCLWTTWRRFTPDCLCPEVNTVADSSFAGHRGHMWLLSSLWRPVQYVSCKEKKGRFAIRLFVCFQSSWSFASLSKTFSLERCTRQIHRVEKSSI